MAGTPYRTFLKVCWIKKKKKKKKRRHTDGQKTHEKMFKNNHYLLEKCKSKLLRGTTLHQPEWPSSKSLQIVNAGEGAEKREPSYSIGGNVHWCNHCGKQYGGFSKN